MAGEPILSVRDVNKTFGGVKALTEVSFDLMPGDILGVIGPNGSGKTTLVNVITGFVKADSGQVLYKGKNLVGVAPAQDRRPGANPHLSGDAPLLQPTRLQKPHRASVQPTGPAHRRLARRGAHGFPGHRVRGHPGRDRL